MLCYIREMSLGYFAEKIVNESNTDLYSKINTDVIMNRTEEALKVIRELSGQVIDISMWDLQKLMASKSPSRMIELEADQPNRATEMLSQIRAVLADHKPGIRHVVMLVSQGLEHPITMRENSILLRGFVEAVGSGVHPVKSFLETDHTLEGGLIVRLLLWTD